MKASGNHCQESLIDVHNAESVERLSHILFYYMKQCIEKDFPSMDIMRDYKDTGYPYGVFVEREGKYEALKNNVLFDSNLTLTIGEYNISRIWLRGSSFLTLEAKGNSIVLVDCFDASKIKITAKNQASVKVNLYGDSECLEIEGKASIKKMNKKVYWYGS